MVAEVSKHERGSSMMLREKVYDAIDSEREYQDQRWGGPSHDQIHELASWVVYMEHYVDKAKAAISSPSTEGSEEITDNIRKVAALAVACMENHGVRPRYFPYVKEK